MPNMTRPQTLAALMRGIQVLRRGWTKGYLAVAPGNYAVHYTDKEAVRFCAMGAIARGMFELNMAHLNDGPVNRLLDRAAGDMGHSNSVTLNDDPSTTVDDVIALFRRAMAKEAF